VSQRLQGAVRLQGRSVDGTRAASRCGAHSGVVRCARGPARRAASKQARFACLDSAKTPLRFGQGTRSRREHRDKHPGRRRARGESTWRQRPRPKFAAGGRRPLPPPACCGVSGGTEDQRLWRCAFDTAKRPDAVDPSRAKPCE
jgi:hypothetical protein